MTGAGGSRPQGDRCCVAGRISGQGGCTVPCTKGKTRGSDPAQQPQPKPPPVPPSRVPPGTPRGVRSEVPGSQTQPYVEAAALALDGADPPEESVQPPLHVSARQPAGHGGTRRVSGRTVPPAPARPPGPFPSSHTRNGAAMSGALGPETPPEAEAARSQSRSRPKPKALPTVPPRGREDQRSARSRQLFKNSGFPRQVRRLTKIMHSENITSHRYCVENSAV